MIITFHRFTHEIMNTPAMGECCIRANLPPPYQQEVAGGGCIDLFNHHPPTPLVRRGLFQQTLNLHSMSIALSTWGHGFHPNRIAYEALQGGKSALDAVELAARYCEADLMSMSVGNGGLPDALGIVTLDASIMDHD